MSDPLSNNNATPGICYEINMNEMASQEPIRLIIQNPESSTDDLGEAVNLLHLFKNSDLVNTTKIPFVPATSSPAEALCDLCCEMSFYTLSAHSEMEQKITQHLPIQLAHGGQINACSRCSQTVEKFHSLYQRCMLSYHPDTASLPAAGQDVEILTVPLAPEQVQSDVGVFAVAVDMHQEPEELTLSPETNNTTMMLPAINYIENPISIPSGSVNIETSNVNNAAKKSQPSVFQIKMPKSNPKKKPIKLMKRQKMTLYPCAMCSANFETLALLQGHCSREHDTYLCSLCGNGTYFKSSLDMQKHLTSEHRTQFSCPLCVRTFLTKSRLSTHIEFMHEDFQGILKNDD